MMIDSFERRKTMLSVSELKEACEFMEREFGADSKVCIQIRDDDGKLIERAYAISMLRDNDGDLYITNHNYKNNK